jgi:hypothetical protein
MKPQRAVYYAPPTSTGSPEMIRGDVALAMASINYFRAISPRVLNQWRFSTAAVELPLWDSGVK